MRTNRPCARSTISRADHDLDVGKPANGGAPASAFRGVSSLLRRAFAMADPVTSDTDTRERLVPTPACWQPHQEQLPS
jgi:hypothetical protein